MIVISAFNAVQCLPDEKRIGHIMLTNRADLKKLSHSEKLSHSMGFSCLVSVDQKLDFIIEINQAFYTNIKECVIIRLIDDFGQKIYDFDSLITSENKEGELIISQLSLQYRDINRYELENSLRSAQSGVLYLCIVDDKDLYVGINSDIYIFKDMPSRVGLRVDERYVNDTLRTLQLVDLNATDLKSQAARVIEEQKFIQSKNALAGTNAVIAFSQCLIAHKNSSNISALGIPKDCENYALELQFLGGNTAVDTMITGYKKFRKTELADELKVKN